MFFDLPVTTKPDRRNYTDFRKYLIKSGYMMIQFSVYSRIVRNHDDSKKYIRDLKRNLPPKGSVRVMIVTEKQYNSIEILVGEKTATEDFLTDEDILEI